MIPNRHGSNGPTSHRHELLGILGTAITPPAILAKPAVITSAEAELEIFLFAQLTWRKSDLRLLTLKGKRSNIMISHYDFSSSKGSTQITFKRKSRSRRIHITAHKTLLGKRGSKIASSPWGSYVPHPEALAHPRQSPAGQLWKDSRLIACW